MGVAANRLHPLYNIASRAPLVKIFRNHPCFWNHARLVPEGIHVILDLFSREQRAQWTENKIGICCKMKIALKTLYIPMYHGYFLLESSVNKLSIIFHLQMNESVEQLPLDQHLFDKNANLPLKSNAI